MVLIEPPFVVPPVGATLKNATEPPHLTKASVVPGLRTLYPTRRLESKSGHLASSDGESNGLGIPA